MILKHTINWRAKCFGSRWVGKAQGVQHLESAPGTQQKQRANGGTGETALKSSGLPCIAAVDGAGPIVKVTEVWEAELWVAPCLLRGDCCIYLNNTA